MNAFDFLLAALAVWRVTALLVRESGPWDVLGRLRRLASGTMAGRALDCFFCTSLWVAAPAAFWLAGTTLRGAIAWLAVSGAASLLERLTAPAEPGVVDLAEAERLDEAAKARA